MKPIQMDEATKIKNVALMLAICGIASSIYASVCLEDGTYDYLIFMFGGSVSLIAACLMYVNAILVIHKEKIATIQQKVEELQLFLETFGESSRSEEK